MQKKGLAFGWSVIVTSLYGVQFLVLVIKYHHVHYC